MRIRSALASVLLQQGRADESEPLLRACVEERPRDVHLRRGLAAARFMQGHADGALDELLEAIRTLRTRGASAGAGAEQTIAALIGEGSAMLERAGRAHEVNAWEVLTRGLPDGT